MYFMYVDESGDIGQGGSDYFILSGVVIHDSIWRLSLDRLLHFRKRMRSRFGLYLREEIHAYDFINHPGPLARIRKSDRLTILRHFLDDLASWTDIDIINVIVDKRTKPVDFEVFSRAWNRLIQRFENTIDCNNFKITGRDSQYGVIIVDDTHGETLTRLIRRMRRHNPVPSMRSPGYKMIPLIRIIEDPSLRDSRESYFIQAADAIAYCLHQKMKPNAYMRKVGGRNYFDRLSPILCRHASRTDPDGIVRI